MAATNIWDQAGRYAVRLDPCAFYEWTLSLPRTEPYFAGWEDTRNVPFPPDPDRTSDTVARIHNLDEGGEPWAVITEIQSEPDALMLGRVNVYGGSLWLERKPDEERGSRYLVSALVVHLTGRGLKAISKIWPRTGLKSLAEPHNFDVADQDAEATLAKIESGEFGRSILPWIPLMQEGDKESIILQWKELGDLETDRRRKSDYGALALIFAEKAGRQDIWEKNLKEWNMVESELLKEWTKEAEERGEKRGEKKGEKKGEKRGKKLGRDEGVRLGILEMLSMALTHRFPNEGPAFAAELQTIQDVDLLRSVQQALFTCDNIDQLRTLLKS